MAESKPRLLEELRERFERFSRSQAEGTPKVRRPQFQFEFENGEVLRLKLYEHLKVG